MSFKNYMTRKIRLNHILSIINSIKTKYLSHFFHHKTYQIPSNIDLRPYMTSVENQLNISSSVANCLAGAYEYLIKKSNDYNINVSRLFIYYNARIKNNNNSQLIIDSGCSITDAIEGLQKFGTCLESIWPYDISNVNIRPNNEAYQQGENHKINKALKINNDLNEMKLCLAQGFPFVFGLKIYSSFDKVGQTGVVPMPNVCDGNRQSDGKLVFVPSFFSHAMLAVGYSDQSNVFIVRNSWGEDWGDKGYCYIPYDYMTNSDLCFDVWTIRKLMNNDFGRDYWHFDDLVNYVNVSYPIENNEEKYTTDSNDYYYHHRKGIIDESWKQYRNYEGNHFSRNDDDYFDNRYRRNRYDRENEPYHIGGYTNNNFYSNRNFSYQFYNRYQDENNLYDDYYDDNQRRSIF